MTFRFRRVLVMAAGLAFAVTFTEAQAPAAAPAPATPPASAATPAAASAPGSEFPAGPGRDTFIRVCSACHAPEQVIGHGQDASGWADTINQMIQNGAQGSDQDFGDIVEYLSTYVGPMPAQIDVNTVTSLALQNWLGFTQQQGDAVVAYRTAHGKFTSLADLEKVPGVDPSALANFKNALTF
ncbi:MAG TPA: helix-hairpin-helix domain-containing protein [Terriglobales bacterium]|nr:helix-hairpin-helix domain-containing protein [Terriglobales bacterium]